MPIAEAGSGSKSLTVEADLRAVTNAVPALISFFDADHICRFANDFHLSWFGRSPESLIGRHIREFIGEEGYAARAPYLARVATGAAVSFDARVPHRDGDMRDAAISYVPRMGPDGFEGCYVLVSDLSRRRQQLAGVLDLAHDAICLRALDGTVTFWNAGCEEAYGWSRAEAMGKPFETLVQSAMPVPAEDAMRQLLSSGHWRGEVVRKLRGGTERIIEARWSLRRDEAGRAVEILEMGHDITTRRRSEEELRLSEYRYRNVFQAMAVSFWELDYAGVGGLLKDLKAGGVTDFRAYFADHPEITRVAMERTRVVDVNDKTLQLVGATRDELIGRSVSPFWPEESEAIFAESLLAAIEYRPYFEADTRLSTIDGRRVEAHLTCCYPARDSSNTVILVGILDITERVRAQNELARAQSELAHAARVATLGELTASIAHEVNQPLTAAVTNAEASLRWLARAEPDLGEAKAAIDRMIAQAKRASDIIARIRAMSTKRAPEKTRFPSRGLVDDAVAILQRELAEQQVRLQLVLAKPTPDIEGDRVQLQQVVINLMVNAIQALGQVDRAGRALVLRLRPEGAHIVLEVEDSGPGIPAEHAARLFTAFFTTKSDGMGIGLSICRTIVEAHGGTIELLPALRQGALFRVTLPAAGDYTSV